MTAGIDTEEVAEQFSNAAATYDIWAEPQMHVAKKLCTFLPDTASHVLDIGCGTGIMSRLIREKYPTASITGIDPAVGMIEQYQKHFANDTRVCATVTSVEEFSTTARFDLVVSTNSFHWFRDKKKALARIFHSLTPNGQFAIATPMARTLRELYESYAYATGTSIHYADLVTEREYAALFLQAGFETQTAVIEEFQLPSPTPMHVISFLQNIGGAPRRLRKDSLLPEQQLHRLFEYYTQHFAVDTGFAVTYQYLYGVLTLPDSR